MVKNMKRLIATVFLAFLMTTPSWAASCWVSEFTSVVTDLGGHAVQIPRIASGGPVTQTATPTTPVALTNAFQSSTRWIWIYCDEVVFYQLGTVPTTGMATAHGNGTLMAIPAGGFWLGLFRAEVDLGTLKIAFCDADCS